MIQKEAENLNGLITTSEIEAVKKKKLPAHKSPGPYGFTGEFYQTFKEESTLTLREPLFFKNHEQGRHTNSFNGTNIVLIPNPSEDTTKKENYKTIFLMNIDAKILKLLAVQIHKHIKRSYTMIKWDSSQGCKDGTVFTNQKA